MDKFYCVTPTGDRPEAFRLCVDYMERQTVRPDLWVIVDDGKTDAVAKQLGRITIPHAVIGLTPMEGNSLVRNLREALRMIPAAAKFCVIEDDDFYPANYLETMRKMLQTAENVGARLHHYYNVAARRFRVFHNARTMALHSSGFAGTGTEFFRILVDQAEKYDVDKVFGKSWGGKREYNDGVLPIHIVGFGTGRPGTTPAHRVNTKTDTTRWKLDPHGEKLREWLGPDAKNYLEDV